MQQVNKKGPEQEAIHTFIPPIHWEQRATSCLQGDQAEKGHLSIFTCASLHLQWEDNKRGCMRVKSFWGLPREGDCWGQFWEVNVFQAHSWRRAFLAEVTEFSKAGRHGNLTATAGRPRDLHQRVVRKGRERKETRLARELQARSSRVFCALGTSREPLRAYE